MQDLLLRLRDALVAYNTLEMRAYLQLKPGRYGWTEKIYCDKAFELWEELLRDHPTDLTTIHHLAIMYHARAFDLEQTTRPSRADADWKYALELWYRLWKTDEYWGMLANHIDADVQNPFSEIRTLLPEQLLQIHFDIAFKGNLTLYRARQHIRFALESPFPEESKEAVRQRFYEQAVRHLSLDIWKSTTLVPELLEPGLQAISTYLKLDSEYLKALTDLFSLLRKLMERYRWDAHMATSPKEDKRVLRKIQYLSAQYDSHIERLERQLADLEPGILDELIEWHIVVGLVLAELEIYEKAMDHYYRTLIVAKHGETDLLRHHNMHMVWVKDVVRVTHHQAIEGETNDSKLRALLDSIAGDIQLPAIFLLLRGETWMQLGEFDAAQRDGDAASSASEWEPEFAEYQEDLSRQIKSRREMEATSWY